MYNLRQFLHIKHKHLPWMCMR